MSDWLFPSFIIGATFGVLLLTIILLAFGIPNFEGGARAVCESHGLDLDSYKYISPVDGFEFVKCKPLVPLPESNVFKNIGGSG